MSRRSAALLAASAVAFVAATALAHLGRLPGLVLGIPYHDAIGHFALFGAAALLAHLALGRRRTRAFGRSLPLGPTLVVAAGMIDELVQALSRRGGFDLTDLFFGILGVVAFVGIDWAVRRRRELFSRFAAEEFLAFVLKEARASFFAGTFLFLIFASSYVHVPGLFRYDLLFLAAIGIQAFMLATKLETWDEAKTIVLFHVIGFALEAYKTNPAIGSWTYPEPGYLKLLGVPLYSGFMYAAIGSYIAHAWKILRLRMDHAPPYGPSVALCVAIYANFFTNHFVYDVRLFLIAAVFALYFRTGIRFTPRQREYRMPLAIGLVLTAAFVWIAENIGTFYGAWQYPSQVHAWEAVSVHKITSWFLMVIISFIIVAYLKHVKAGRTKQE